MIRSVLFELKFLFERVIIVFDSSHLQDVLCCEMLNISPALNVFGLSLFGFGALHWIQ